MSRRRGVGSITSYQTKAGERWRWQIRVPVDPDNPDAGTRPAGQGGYRTSTDADDGLQEARRKIRDHEKFSTTAPTIATFTTEWLDGLRLEKSTIAGYRKDARNHVIPYLGKIRVDNLTATRLARHYRELEDHGRKDRGHEGEPLSANSVQKVHVLLGAMLDAAVDDGLISVNPARKRKTVKAPTGKRIRAAKPEIITWTAEQLNAFMEWDRDVFRDDLYALWRTIGGTGMRRSEALTLRWADVDLEHGAVSVRRAADVTTKNTVKSTKNQRSRNVTIDGTLAGVLKSWKAVRGSLDLSLARGDAYVFGNLAGEIRSPNEISRRWRLRVERAGDDIDLPKVTLHGLRHSHATILLGLGVHPKVVQERLGHSSISVTMDLYSHVSESMQREAVDKLAAVLK